MNIIVMPIQMITKAMITKNNIYIYIYIYIYN